MASPKQLVALVVPEEGAERLLELAEHEPAAPESPRRSSGWSHLLSIATGVAIGGAFALYASAREQLAQRAPEPALPADATDLETEAVSDDD